VKASGNIRISVCVSKFAMADPAEEVPAAIEDEEPEETPGYTAPAQKTLDEIQKLDADDESLVRYKQTLLGGNVTSCKLKVIS
jgi:HAMP domain-containing protein